jgi:hypothetical protein
MLERWRIEMKNNQKLRESKWIKYLSPGTPLARWLALLQGTAHLTNKLETN